MRGDHEVAFAARDDCRELVTALGMADPPPFVDFYEGA